MLRNFLAVIKLTFLKRDFPFLMFVSILPVSISLLMIFLFSAETPLNLPIGVVNLDHSHLSRQIEKSIAASPVLRIEADCVDLNSCESKMRSGEILGIIIIPPQLEKKAHRMEAPAIPVYTNAQSLLTNNIIVKELRTAIGTQAAIFERKNIPDPLSMEIHGIGNPTGNYIGYLGIGLIAAIFHLAGMICGVYALSYPIREKQVDLWLQTAGNFKMIAVFGKCIPIILLLWFELIAVHVFARSFTQPMFFSEFIMVAFGELAMLAACVFAGASWVGITGSMRISTSIAGVIGGPAFAFSGQTFPILAMPFIVRCFAFLLPLTHLLELQSSMQLGDAGLPAAWNSFKILCGMAIFWISLTVLSFHYRLGKAL